VKIESLYPVVSYGDLCRLTHEHKPLTFRVLSSDAIEFNASGFWGIESIKDGSPVFQYTLARLRCTERDFNHDIDDFSELRFSALVIEDVSDNKQKLLLLESVAIGSIIDMDINSSEYEHTMVLTQKSPDDLPRLKLKVNPGVYNGVRLVSFNDSNINLRKFIDTHVRRCTTKEYTKLRDAHRADWLMLNAHQQTEQIRLN
jgi:hypothetical protein